MKLRTMRSGTDDSRSLFVVNCQPSPLRITIPPRHHGGSTVLVLSRKEHEAIWIDGDIKIVVIEIDRNKVRLGIEAPLLTKIYREELLRNSEGLQGRSQIGPQANLSLPTSPSPPPVKESPRS